MTEAKIRKDILSAMRGAGVKLSADILSNCTAIAMNYKLSPDHLVSSWEVYSLNTNAKELNTHTFPSFRTTLLKDAGKSTENTPLNTGTIISRPILGKRPLSPDVIVDSPPRSKSKQTLDISPQTVLVTPSKKDMNSSSKNVPTPSINMKKLYEDRKNAGQIMASFNPQKLDSLPINNTDNKIKASIAIDPYSKNVPDIYRHLSHQVKQRSDALDDQLNEFQMDMVEQYSIPSNISSQSGTNEESEQQNDVPKMAPLEPTGLPRQSVQTNIGRICNEVHEGKLNSTTILLEGSKQVSNGARIELDVHHLNSSTSSGGEENKLSSYSLFPGQIVAVEGINPTGRKMVVSKITDGFPSQPRATPSTVSKQEVNSNGMKIWSVTGPYTTNQDLDYRPFTDMLAMIEGERPDVVIMMGPFVDMEQPLLKDGCSVTLDFLDENDETNTVTKHVSYEALFVAKIARELEYLYEENPDLKTQFILVPSLQDAICDPVYPQPPLQDLLPNGGKILPLFPESDDLPYGCLGLDAVETVSSTNNKANSRTQRIHLASNPSTIDINGVTIGLTSTDSLLHLSTEEINSNLPVGSRLTKLTEHFLRQRSYYPLFPPPTNPNMDVNLDLTKREFFQMPCKPDILILPSKLACFAKDILGGTVVVNPGHLVRGAAGGTYATIDIHPTKTQDGNNSDRCLTNCMKVDIRRI